MITSFKCTLAAALLAAFSYVPLQAHAGLFDDNEARQAIIDLRAKIDAANTRFDTEQTQSNARLDTKADKNSVIELNNQNEQLLKEIAKLRGQIEVLTNDLANSQQRQKDFYVDLDNRLRKLEPQKVLVDGREASVEPSEQKAYDAALALFKDGDYKNAGVTFADFLRRYPQSGYASHAQYSLGNSYYAQRDYANAIATLQIFVKKYAENAKAPEALLNIATCQMELKEKTAAKKTLLELVAQYPNSPQAQNAKERLALIK